MPAIRVTPPRHVVTHVRLESRKVQPSVPTNTLWEFRPSRSVGSLNARAATVVRKPIPCWPRAISFWARYTP